MTAPTPRMSSARLSEIREWAESCLHQGERENLFELLHELREVTRERDEALAGAQKAGDLGLDWHDELLECKQERDKLKQERDEAHGLINATVSGLETPVSTAVKRHLGYRDLAEQLECLTVKVKELEEFYDTHVNDTLESDALRAEVERAWQVHNEHLNGPYTALQKGMHALRAELERERKEHGYTDMAADVEAKWADEFNAECKTLRAENAKLKAVADIRRLVDRFLAWELPKSVCADRCATMHDYQFSRTGTVLLTADEARQMFEHVLALDPKEGA